ncbi:MAG: hypothetical protein JW786_09385 [Desulfobacterales bacterium]|nr:hypothetical protein [Desulfobacterales bacterium]
MEAWNPDDPKIPAKAQKAIRNFEKDLKGLDIYAGKLLERRDAETALALFRVLLFYYQDNAREKIILANRIGHCHHLLNNTALARACHEAVIDTTEKAVFQHAAGREAVIDSFMQLCRDSAISSERMVAILLRLEDQLPRSPGKDKIKPLAQRIWIPEAQEAILKALTAVGEVQRLKNYYLNFQNVLKDYGFKALTLPENVRKALEEI